MVPSRLVSWPMGECKTYRDNDQDISSPTIATESLYTPATVFASERRRVVTVDIDIEGAFLHGVMTSEIYMDISGQCLDVLLYNYKDIYVKMINNDKVYMRLDQALYKPRSRQPRCGIILFPRT